MTHEQFIDLTARMRSTQKSYFRTRTKDPVAARAVLEESKRLEREVDAAIEAYRQAEQPQQTNLFDA